MSLKYWKRVAFTCRRDCFSLSRILQNRDGTSPGNFLFQHRFSQSSRSRYSSKRSILYFTSRNCRKVPFMHYVILINSYFKVISISGGWLKMRNIASGDGNFLKILKNTPKWSMDIQVSIMCKIVNIQDQETKWKASF